MSLSGAFLILFPLTGAFHFPTFEQYYLQFFLCIISLSFLFAPSLLYSVAIQQGLEKTENVVQSNLHGDSNSGKPALVSFTIGKTTTKNIFWENAVNALDGLQI